METKLFHAILPVDDGFLLDIYTAASIGAEERIRDIVENSDKTLLNMKNSKGWTPLMYAAGCVELKVLRYLLNEGSNPDIQNNQGQTALMLASKCGSSDVVNLLIENGASLHLQDKKGWSALSFAKKFGHRIVIQLLTDKEQLINRHQQGLDTNPNGCRQNKADYSLWQMPSPSVTGNQVSEIGLRKNLATSETDLKTLFETLNLSKYYSIFKEHNIDLPIFWTLDEEDLKEIGINLMGPRKKLSLKIAEHHKNCATENPNGISAMITENKQLKRKNKELEKLLALETERKVTAERNLTIGIQTLKDFTVKVQNKVIYNVRLEERLSQIYQNMKEALCAPNAISAQTRNVISPLIISIEKLITEMYTNSYETLSLTDFGQTNGR